MYSGFPRLPVDDMSARALGLASAHEATVAHDVKQMNEMSDGLFSSALECAVNFCSDPTGSSDLLESVSSLAETNKVEPRLLRNAVRTLVLVIRAGVTRQLSSSALESDLLSLGLVEERVRVVSDVFVKHGPAVASSITDQTITVNELVDMQWKFGVTAANTELSQVGSTLLQMKLVVDKGGKMENIFAELTLPQFYAFLAEMEQANVALNDLA